MKISYIANVRIPTEKAHGIQIMKMCEAFADLGNEVELIVPKRKNLFKDDPYNYYGVRNNFKIIKLNCLDTVRFGFLGFILESISFSGFVFWHFLFKKRDIYYGRDYLSLLYLVILGRKVVWESHTGEWNIFVKLLLKFSKKFVVISNGLKKFYISKGVRPENILIAHDGVDLKDFEVKMTKEDSMREYGVKTNLPIVLYVGKLDSSKGVETLLKAGELLKDRVSLIIVGGENVEVEKLKLNYKNALFLGYKPYKELPRILKMADVLVIPNSSKEIVSREFTSPLKLFAYMASGVPIVASDIPSIREILNEENAFFAKADSPESFVEIIKKVIINISEKEKKATKALNNIRDFSWFARAEKIVDSIH